MRLVVDSRRTNNNIRELSDQIAGLIPLDNREIVIVCIGSDRNIGDSLAPIVGSVLKNSYDYIVYGTIEHPVHALNLKDTRDYIYKHHHNPYIIAIDASLGVAENQWKILVQNGGLHPGKGLGKDIPPIGDIGVLGVVGRSDITNKLEILHQARLYDVLGLADTMVRVIRRSLVKWRSRKDEFNREK